MSDDGSVNIKRLNLIMRQQNIVQSQEVHMTYDFREKFVEVGDPYAMEMNRRHTPINAFKPLSASNISLGIKMFHIFSKMYRSRLVMQSFMKLKLVYGLSMINRKRLNSSSSSKSINMKEIFTSRRQSRNRLLYNNAEQSSAELSTSRAKLLSNIMTKLQKSGNQKVNTKRVSALAQNRVSDRTVSSKLDSLEKILKDIKKCNEQSARMPNSYAKKRAMAKGQPPKWSPDHVTKPSSAVTVEPYENQQVVPTKVYPILHNQQQRYLPHKVVNGPIEQRDEASEIGNTRKLEAIAETDTITFRRESRWVDELQTISSELNELRKTNEEYIKKNTVIMRNQTHVIQYNNQQHHETKWLKTEQSTESRLNIPNVWPDVTTYIPPSIVIQEQPRIQSARKQQLRGPNNVNHQSDLNIQTYQNVRQPDPHVATSFQKTKSRSVYTNPASNDHFQYQNHLKVPSHQGFSEVSHQPSLRPNATLTIPGRPQQQPIHYQNQQYNIYVEPNHSPKGRYKPSPQLSTLRSIGQHAAPNQNLTSINKTYSRYI